MTGSCCNSPNRCHLSRAVDHLGSPINQAPIGGQAAKVPLRDQAFRGETPPPSGRRRGPASSRSATSPSIVSSAGLQIGLFQQDRENSVASSSMSGSGRLRHRKRTLRTGSTRGCFSRRSSGSTSFFEKGRRSARRTLSSFWTRHEQRFGPDHRGRTKLCTAKKRNLGAISSSRRSMWKAHRYQTLQAADWIAGLVGRLGAIWAAPAAYPENEVFSPLFSRNRVNRVSHRSGIRT